MAWQPMLRLPRSALTLYAVAAAPAAAAAVVAGQVVLLLAWLGVPLVFCHDNLGSLAIIFEQVRALSIAWQLLLRLLR